ncbi:MAG: hypothetical protein M3275_07930 [Thermoproteota archaeon]|nr:hypothetical protein [Thermoproteota archaeon]
MSPIAKALKKEEHPDRKEYLQNELKSLGIEPDHLLNQPNDKKEEKLQSLAESIKSAYYQAYKTAYSSSSSDDSSSQGNNNKDG